MDFNGTYTLTSVKLTARAQLMAGYVLENSMNY